MIVKHFARMGAIVMILFFSTGISGQNSFLVRAGDNLQLSLPAVALASTFIYKGDDKPYCQFLKSYGTTLVITYGLKYSVNRTRPDGGPHSFPSGHTSSAFAGAAFLHLRYGWKVGVPAYALASLVGYSRVYAGRHYWSDVVAAAVIGIAPAVFFVKPYRKHKNKIAFRLLRQQEFYTVGISYKW